MKQKARFNKFIFQGGTQFLRLKTLSDKTVKVAKQGENYDIDFYKTSDHKISIPVVWLQNFNGEETIGEQSTSFNNAEDDFARLMLVTKEPWGHLTRLKIKNDETHYYYLAPKNKSYAVRIGPILVSLDGKDIEMDLKNVQWGSEA